MLVVLVLSWGMMLNISKLLCDRIALQNAADNAVLSAAVNQARTINLIAKINSMMARVLYDSTFLFDTYGFGGVYPETWAMGAGKTSAYSCFLLPFTPQIFHNDVTRIGSMLDIIPGGYKACGYGSRMWYWQGESKTGANAIMVQMKLLNTTQEGIFLVGPANSGRIARYIAKKQGTGQAVNTEDTSVELGFLNNILELSAANVDLFFQEGIEYARGVLSLGLKKNTKKTEYFGALHKGATIPPIPPIGYPGDHVHLVLPDKIGNNYCNLHHRYESWYYADSNSFYKKKLNVCVRKKADSYNKVRYPMFAKWIGIEWPDLMAVASASIYNKTPDNHGRPSFVLKSDPWEGTAIKENIEAYDDSKKGGWYAHLTSVGGMLH